MKTNHPLTIAKLFLVVAALSLSCLAPPLARGQLTDSTTLRNLPLQVLGSNIASASNLHLELATGDLVHITGTTTVTALGTVMAGREMCLIFDGILTFTHNATTLILPAAANITTEANASAIMRSLGSGNWICVNYSAGAGGSGATLTGSESLSNKTLVSPAISGTVAVASGADFVAAGGAADLDWSLSSGVFKTPTGVSTYAGSSNLFSAALRPATDDGAALGDTTHNWSDLFVATGAVINYQNGNVVLTHSSGILTMGTGELRITTAGTNAASVPTLGSTSTETNKTFTSPVINTPTVKQLTEVVTATNVIAASETGTTFFLNSATEFVSTLPAPAAGLHFIFIVSAAPSGASYTIVCNAAATIIKGHVLTNDVNSVTDADFGTAGEGTITIVDGKAVAGDIVEVWCDGTNWFMRAECTVFDAITLS